MKTVDFGKNIFQFEIGFKIDCISPDTIRAAGEHFVLKKKAFTSFGKDPQTSQSNLTKGTGTEPDPIHQIRFSADKINMWVGWYTSYEEWQMLRNESIRELATLVTVPLGIIAYLGSQATMTIPNKNLKRVEEVSELESLVAFHRRYIPKELFARQAGRSLFLDELNTMSIEFQVGGTPDQQETTISHIVRRMVMDEKLSFDKNLLSFADHADSLFEAFHSVAVVPFLKT